LDAQGSGSALPARADPDRGRICRELVVKKSPYRTWKGVLPKSQLLLTSQ
jgi:hypothetical protein